MVTRLLVVPDAYDGLFTSNFGYGMARPPMWSFWWLFTRTLLYHGLLFFYVSDADVYNRILEW